MPSITKLCELLHSGLEILALFCSNILFSWLYLSTRAHWVQYDVDEALRPSEICLVIVLLKLQVDVVGAGPAVDAHHHRVLGRRIKVGREVHPRLGSYSVVSQVSQQWHESHGGGDYWQLGSAWIPVYRVTTKSVIQKGS